MCLHPLSSILFALLALVSFATRATAAQGFGRAPVVAMQPARTTDFGLLDAGFDVGRRVGMVCHVTRGALSVGDVVLVELRPTASAALIRSLTPNQAILSGDLVAV